MRFRIEVPTIRSTALVAVLLAAMIAVDGVASAQPTFTNVALEVGLESVYSTQANSTIDGGGGAAIGDYNNDGFLDVFACGYTNADKLFRNNGDGTFTDVSESTGFDFTQGRRSNGAAWGDLDNDGDLDIYVASAFRRQNYLYVNDGTGFFTEQSELRGVALSFTPPGDDFPLSHNGTSVAIGDYDKDGWLDIHVAEWNGSLRNEPREFSHMRLLRNLGAPPPIGAGMPGFFEDVTDAAGVAIPLNAHVGFSNAFVDLNQDSYPDLVLGADFRQSQIFWNNGDGTFRNGTDIANVGDESNGMGMTFGDFDGDGDLDWLQTSIYDGPGAGRDGNYLYSYGGNDQFDQLQDFAGVQDGGWGWGACFFDYDNDGDLDLTNTNGANNDSFRFDSTRFWENQGGGQMTEMAFDVGIVDSDIAGGLHTFDFDGDGDLDILIVNTFGNLILYRNDGGDANPWLRVRLYNPEYNTEGLNAKLWVTVNEGDDPQYREMGVRSHYLGHSERVSHFGLGAGATAVYELRIEWLDGVEMVFNDLEVNQHLLIDRGQDAFAMPDYIGLSETAARAMIEAANLVVGEVKVNVFFDVDGDTTMGQFPPVGMNVIPGTVVNLVVSEPTPANRAAVEQTLLDGFDAADTDDNGLSFEEAQVALPNLDTSAYATLDGDGDGLVTREELGGTGTEGVTEGGGEGITEGSTEGSTEGVTEGDGEGSTEGEGEGDTEGSNEGSAEGDGEGSGGGGGGCPSAAGAGASSTSGSADLVLMMLAVAIVAGLRRRDTAQE